MTSAYYMRVFYVFEIFFFVYICSFWSCSLFEFLIHSPLLCLTSISSSEYVCVCVCVCIHIKQFLCPSICIEDVQGNIQFLNTCLNFEILVLFFSFRLSSAAQTNGFNLIHPKNHLLLNVTQAVTKEELTNKRMSLCSRQIWYWTVVVSSLWLWPWSETENIYYAT